MPLEGPDDLITLRRAAALGGLAKSTISVQTYAGKLRMVRRDHLRLTTRRWLHEYLTAASGRDRGHRKPLPADYVAPE
jgi:hypothetical protein